MALVAAAVLLVPATGAFAAHYADEGNGCSSCHSLNSAEGEPGTSYINSITRTLQSMKAANSGTAPATFGCTYCHNNAANASMQGVLDDFRGLHASKHPTGYNYVAGSTTQSYYLSGVGSTTPNEIDCVDCHDVTLLDAQGSLQHVGHAPAGVGSRAPAVNPFMLRNVTVNKEYDGLCRMCHTNAGLNPGVVVGKGGGKVITLASHADGNVGGVIQADNLVHLKPADTAGNKQCTTCHDTHYSNNVKFFNDGHEGDTPVASNDCISICHYAGDATGYTSDTVNPYTRHSHGRAKSTYKYKGGVVDYVSASANYQDMAMACSACHDAIDTTDTSSNRKKHNVVPTSGATNDIYKKRYNLSLAVQSWDTGSSFGNPLVGVCGNCHAAYDNHTGTTGNTGCQDCHSTHGENSGATSNVFMIPLNSKKNGTYVAAAKVKAGTEAITYSTERRDPVTGNPRANVDQYRTDGTGVCDNLECHGPPNGTIGALSVLMGAGGTHPAGTQSSGADCESCHKHNGDSSGGWRATDSCNGCHDYPGLAHQAGAHVLTTTHDKHTGTAAGKTNSKGYACSVCHYQSTHNNAGIANPAQWTVVNVDTNVQVRFDPSWNPGTSNPADTNSDSTSYNDATNTCSNLYCHSPGGTGTAPVWSGGPLACTQCHGDTSATMATQSHGVHLTTSTGAGAVCDNCHTAKDLDPAGNHANGTVTFVAGLTYTGNTADKVTATNLGNCGTNFCHNNGQLATPRTASYTWGTAINGSNSCTECHGDTSATLTTGAHAKHLNGTGYVCTDCHAAATLNSHADGTITFVGAMAYTGDTTVASAGGTFGSCSTGSCHNATAGVNIVWNTTPTNCNQCHYAAADANNWNGKDKTATMINATEYSAATVGGHGSSSPRVINKLCTDCHNLTIAHDFSTNLGGANPFRLRTDFNCTNLAGCHTGSTSGPATGVVLTSIVSHTGANMVAAGYTTKRTWPGWAATMGCVNCHDPHGDGNNSMIGRATYDKAAFTLLAGPPPAFPTLQTNMTFTDVTTGASTAGNAYGDLDAPYLSLCQVCHQDASVVSFKSGSTAAGTNHPSSGGNPGDCSGCHKHDGAFKPLSCNGCHDYPGLAHQASAHVLSSQHDKHAGTPAGFTNSKGYACSVCHYNSTHNNANINSGTQWTAVNVDTNVQVRFDPAWNPLTSNPASTDSDSTSYNDATNTCSNLYCHNPGATGVAAPSWTGGALACTACHGDTSATMTTYGHQAHLTTSTGGGQVCNDCHTPYDLSQGGNHNNSTLNFVGGAAGYTGNTADKVTATNLGNCGTNACHNNGQLGTPRTAAYTWGTTVNGLNSCTECHGDTTATLTTQAHVKHLNAGYVCTDCHAAQTLTTHNDGTITFSGGLAYTGDTTIAVNGGTFGSCSTASCHNAVAGTNIAWNTTPTSCDQCHYGNADANNWNGKDKTATMINATEYTAANTGGHGSSVPRGINKLCTDCHNLTIAHDFSTNLGGANPFRLRTDFNCTNLAGCHTGSTAGPQTGVTLTAILTHNPASMIASGGTTKRTWPAWSANMGCVNCHDPHGDGNVSMIGRATYDKAAFTLLAGPPPAFPTLQTNLTFTDNSTGASAAGTSYGNTGAPYLSICQVCHQDASVVSWKSGASASGTNHPTSGGNPGDCTGCHKHDGGFRASGCSGCHGDGGAKYWPQNAASALTNYPNRNGRHLKHMDAIGMARFGVSSGSLSGAQQQTICGMCHNDPLGVGGGGHDAAPAPADVGSITTMWSPYSVDAGAVYNAATYTGNVWNAGSATCNTVSCHDKQLTPSGYEWYGASTTACVMCHNDITSAAVPTGQTHNSHMNTVANGLGQVNACTTCHASGAAIVWGAPGTAPSANHINGTFTVSGTTTFTYTGTYPTTFGGCGINACHNNGQLGTPRTAAYSWGTSIANCLECHGDTSASLSTGSHTAHLTTSTGGGQLCSDCHAAPSLSTHINGTINVPGTTMPTPLFTYTGDVTVASNGGTFGTCGTNGCHNNGQLATPRTASYTWGTAINGTNSCVECHGDTSATLTTQAHDAHLALGSAYVVCTDCHSSPTLTTHNNGTINFSGALSIAYAGGDVTVASNGGTFGTCAAGSCHNATAGTNIAWNLTQTNCNQCHYAAADTNNWNGKDKTATMISAAEYSAANTGGHGSTVPNVINKLCTDCHNVTIAHDFTTNLGGGNPFRLRTDFNCTNLAGCHTGSTVGPQTGVTLTAILSHTGANMVAAGYTTKRTWPGWAASIGCVNCHDPHGDGNLSMIGRATYDKAAFTLLAGPPPAFPTLVTNMAFTDNATGASAAGTSYGNTGAPYLSICQVCHQDASMVSWKSGSSASGTNHPTSGGNPGDCSGCHKHDKAFSPAGGACDGCHGASGNYWPIGSTYPNTAGSHVKHVTAIGGGNASCDHCHPGIPPVGHSSDTSTGLSQAELIRMDMTGTGTPTKWLYLEGSGATTGTLVYYKDLSSVNDTNAYYRVTDSKCYNQACHGEQPTPVWGTTVAQCMACHSTVTSHTTLTKGGAANSTPCTSCHPGGTAYPSAHNKNGAAKVVLIPNNPRVGINRIGNGETGIYLGGDATSAWTFTTEAEICWRCHDLNGNGSLNDAGDVSEWGTNDAGAATPANGQPNLGTLNQLSWIGATWTPGVTNFPYKVNTIASTHSANSAGATSGVDAVANIRCSYCHDVHDQNLATGDTYSGKPYLRGGWVSNPYKWDGAPQSGTTYANTNTWGAVPRASSAQATMGGYWIDKNMGSPNSWSTNQFGGLCGLCHNGATAQPVWTGAGIGAISYYDAGYTGWVSGLNGHANSVKGGTWVGTESTARNIFNTRFGAAARNANYAPIMHYQGSGNPGENSTGFRGTGGSGAKNYAPQFPSASPRKYATDEWGVDEYGTQTQTNFHTFTCSKCHNPHASRLPRLMVSNCLDTKHNTWDNAYQAVAVGTLNLNRSLSNWSSSQNCHRLAGEDFGAPRVAASSSANTNAGWNKVTPW